MIGKHGSFCKPIVRLHTVEEDLFNDINILYTINFISKLKLYNTFLFNITFKLKHFNFNHN